MRDVTPPYICSNYRVHVFVVVSQFINQTPYVALCLFIMDLELKMSTQDRNIKYLDT